MMLNDGANCMAGMINAAGELSMKLGRKKSRSG